MTKRLHFKCILRDLAGRTVLLQPLCCHICAIIADWAHERVLYWVDRSHAVRRLKSTRLVWNHWDWIFFGNLRKNSTVCCILVKDSIYRAIRCLTLVSLAITCCHKITSICIGATWWNCCSSLSLNQRAWVCRLANRLLHDFCGISYKLIDAILILTLSDALKMVITFDINHVWWLFVNRVFLWLQSKLFKYSMIICIQHAFFISLLS